MRDNATMSRRKKLARIIASGKAKNGQEALVKAGYRGTTAHSNSSNIIKSPEVQNELARLGFNQENAKSAVSEVLNAPMITGFVTADAKISAAREVFRVTGAYAPEKRVNVNGSLIDLLKMVNEAQNNNADDVK